MGLLHRLLPQGFSVGQALRPLSWGQSRGGANRLSLVGSRGHAGCHNGQDHSEKDLGHIQTQIKNIVESNEVVLFMKGTPDSPQCGYSKAATTILSRFPIQLATVDVLSNELVRAGIKQFTSWPTIPQVFVKGEFIGGADILVQLFRSNELEALLRSKGLLKEETPPSSQQTQDPPKGNE